MKLKTFYDRIIKKGIKEDQRPKEAIAQVLKDAKKEYRKAKGLDKKAFDKERLTNPYGDTRLLNGTGEEEIRTILVGIDIDPSELLLADRLRDKGVEIDLVISHHPSGRGLSSLHSVMDIQPKLWEKYGFSKEIAEGIMKDRIEQVARGIAPGNNSRTSDAAKLLGLPFMCTHTVADNCVANYLQKIFDKKKPKNLKNVLTILKSIIEYRMALEEGAGPFLLIGDEKSDAGRIFVDMTGGTSGPDRIFARLSQSGVQTVVGMHCKESGYKVAKNEFMNFVIAGHISSDNLGMNILLDDVDKKNTIKIIECAGYRRVRRSGSSKK